MRADILAGSPFPDYALPDGVLERNGYDSVKRPISVSDSV